MKETKINLIMSIVAFSLIAVAVLVKFIVFGDVLYESVVFSMFAGLVLFSILIIYFIIQHKKELPQQNNRNVNEK